MKVLMISTDRKILEEGSAVRARMVLYGTICDELHIILASVGGRKETASISGNVFVHPTASLCAAFSRLSLFLSSNLISADLVTAQDPFETGFAAWYMSKRVGARLEIQIHTDFLSPYFGRGSFINKIRVLIAGIVLPRADGIRVVSERIANSLGTLRLLPGANITVLPIYVDIEKIRNSQVISDLRKKYPQFDFMILMTSRLTKEKNISLAIEAMREIINRHPKAGLVIVGSGPEEVELKLLAKKYNLQPSIVFESWSDDVISYMKTADCFLLTSNYEGFGLSLVEAAASDCPIISTEVGIIGELLRPEEDILACPVGDAGCILDRLERLMNSPGLAHQLSLKAQSSFKPLIMSKEDYLKKLRTAWEKCF
ncbi:MAG: glycosyltransferase [Candidatus Paceibacterota bacterium]